MKKLSNGSHKLIRLSRIKPFDIHLTCVGSNRILKCSYSQDCTKNLSFTEIDLTMLIA